MALGIYGQVEQLLLELVAQYEVLVGLGLFFLEVVDLKKIAEEMMNGILVFAKPEAEVLGAAQLLKILKMFLILKIGMIDWSGYVIYCFQA